MTIRLALLLSLLSIALAASACASVPRAPSTAAASPVRTFTGRVMLRGEPFELHLVQPSAPLQPDVIVLYASGDGGWFGAAVDMFKAIGADGFCAVGLSSRTLMHRTLPGGRPLAVSDLAEDYRTILDYASTQLHLPADRRVVLTGWSRGASLAVLTGGSRHAMPGLAGVIAIGLTEDENLTVVGDSDDDPAEAPAGRTESSLEMYPLLAQVAPRRVAVIQSTGDAYLGAARARQLFGPDTDDRRFFGVTAKNHRFGGGKDAFATALQSALAWVVEAN